MTDRPLCHNRVRERGLAAGIFGLAAFIFAYGAQQLPIEAFGLGFDWRPYWAAYREGWPVYPATIFNPPWTLLMLWPIAVWPFGASWGLLAFFTYAVLLATAPRRGAGSLDGIAVLALLSSYMVIRQIADGNLALLMIGGFWLLGYGWKRRRVWAVALSILLITAKPQESWLVLLWLAVRLVVKWPLERWLQVAAIFTLLAMPGLLWLGRDWWRGLFPSELSLSAQVARPFANISLVGAEGYLGWPSGLTLLAVLCIGIATLGLLSRRQPGFSPAALGLCVSASLLLSPYSNEHSVVTVLAISVIPLWRRAAFISPGLTLVLWTYLPYASMALGLPRHLPEPVWTAWLAAVWAWCVVTVWRSRPGSELFSQPNFGGEAPAGLTGRCR